MARHLVLHEGTYRKVVDHAARESPIEAVGLLAGHAAGDVLIASDAVELEAWRNERFFVVEPYSQFQALRSLRARQLSMVAIYHSHPMGSPSMSAADLEFAHLWDCPHVIVGSADVVDGSGGWCIRAWDASGYGPVELPTVVTARSLQRGAVGFDHPQPGGG